MGTRSVKEIDLGGRKITLSNVDKPMFPSGFTKGDVIDYYIRVASYLLPHLKDRPVTLKRYPNGVGGKHFYEKDAPKYTPPWIQQYPVPRRSGEENICYVLLNDLPSLVWSANLANLEMHPFLHRVPDLDTPTAMVFDLDPGEGATILKCAEVALLLKERLEAEGLRSLVKVSGSKGLQVYVPLNTPVRYQQTGAYSRRLAESLERDHAQLVVSEMAKAKRHEKVFIDWSQNSDFKTTVAPYSLRAKQDKPYISLPVTWDELGDALKKSDASRLYFEPEQALGRLDATGDLFKPLFSLRQKLDSPSKYAAVKSAGAKPASDGLRKLPPADMQFVQPMRAALVAELPDGPEWQYEVKFDGYRALAVKNHDNVQLLSRNDHPLNARFPDIAAAVGAVPNGTILDGEIVALDQRGRPSFNLLQNYQSSAGTIVYYVFDLVAFRGKSLTGLPLSERRRLLENSVIEHAGEPVRLSERLNAPAGDVIRAAREQKLEGIVAKRASSRYEPGKRSGAWLKVKLNRGQEFVVGGYIPGRNGFESLLVGYYDGRKLIFIAKVKNGFDAHKRRAVWQELNKFETKVCPFANLPEPKNARRGEALTAEVMKKCVWLKPALVAQVEFTEMTKAHHLRHSRFMALRDDKDPHEIVLESAA